MKPCPVFLAPPGAPDLSLAHTAAAAAELFLRLAEHLLRLALGLLSLPGGLGPAVAGDLAGRLLHLAGGLLPTTLVLVSILRHKVPPRSGSNMTARFVLILP